MKRRYREIIEVLEELIDGPMLLPSREVFLLKEALDIVELDRLTLDTEDDDGE